MSTVPQHPVTPEEYLAFERASEQRHEYVDGDIVAMSGARVPHMRVVGNIGASLHAQFRGRPCEIFMNNFRVKISEAGMYAYPDVTALCGEVQLEDNHFDTLLSPGVIFEVLSPSTEWYDRGKKRECYQRRATLRMVDVYERVAPFAAEPRSPSHRRVKEEPV